jgi:lipoprotein-anchoring transpeptidase ErfK/SrfK
VPAEPASHGCARLPLPEAKIVYAFARIGTPVRVI